MLGVYVCLGNQRTGRFVLPSTTVSIGAHDHNALVLRDGGVQPVHCTLTLGDRGWVLSFARPSVVYVNNQLARSPFQLHDRDELRLGGYRVVLALRQFGDEPASGAVERDLIAAVADGDEAAQLVYADWLEEHGDRFRADFLRLHAIAFADGTNASNRQVRAQRKQLRDLATHIDQSWLMQIARTELT